MSLLKFFKRTSHVEVRWGAHDRPSRWATLPVTTDAWGDHHITLPLKNGHSYVGHLAEDGTGLTEYHAKFEWKHVSGPPLVFRQAETEDEVCRPTAPPMKIIRDGGW